MELSAVQVRNGSGVTGASEALAFSTQPPRAEEIRDLGPQDNAGAKELGTDELRSYGVEGLAGYLLDVQRQVLALLKKNIILSYRNKVSTFLRIFVSFFFMLMIFLVNTGLRNRYGVFPIFQDLTDPKAELVNGIPKCSNPRGRDNCATFAYTPAISEAYVPESDFDSAQTFAEHAATIDGGFCSISRPSRPLCQEEDCTSGLRDCRKCCQLYRTHKVVRAIMRNNGTGAEPILADQVRGFRDEDEMDDWMMANPEYVQGGYIFSSLTPQATTFVVLQNSTPFQRRGDWFVHMVERTVPYQVAASSAIAEEMFLGNEKPDIHISLADFPHPPVSVASFDGRIAPLFLMGCAMFPFVIQMSEVAVERELKLRQALAAMGLHDLSYWLSWHIFQSGMAMLGSFLLYSFGCMFQFSVFLKNDFGVIFLTFWLFGQALIGFSFFIGAMIRRSSQAVTVGFGGFLIGFLLFFMVSVFGFPYGLYDREIPFSYEDGVGGGIVRKTNGDVLFEPIFAFIPFTLLIKDIADMGRLTEEKGSEGLRFWKAHSYCTLEQSCSPRYSIAKSWEWFIGLYIMYSVLAIYLDNVLPDAMGVKKPLWYFLSPRYWGFGSPTKLDEIESIEESTDEDVLAEERKTQAGKDQGASAEHAVEVRGLQARFQRGGKPFYAVKAPWYGMLRKQLFCLLGPNGAGKTTTINMLTGALPATKGHALIFGHTTSHTTDMSRIRRIMGVCTQFDTLWPSLSGKEHLELFATIKGVPRDSIRHEAARRLEEVRLTAAGDLNSAAYSGGMRRRLSVAIALIGNPQVVFLDEPTTGMDPINRRRVWDVIEAAKQDRCVVLTTHSMEEADILGDRIAIMAKGRLRCLGNSVRLKSRFGAGFRVSVGCKKDQKPDEKQGVRELFERHLSCKEVEANKAYMHYTCSSEAEGAMASLFEELEDQKEQLGVSDVQIGMSTLEDVFLKIAKDSEAEEALRENKKTKVTLSNGEEVGVLLGGEEELTSPNGIRFSVKWGTDENGNLIAVDTFEEELVNEEILVTVPETVEGNKVQVFKDGAHYAVDIPEGVTAGQNFTASVSVARKKAGSMTTEGLNVGAQITRKEVIERVNKLESPFKQQALALGVKNFAYQKKLRYTNCCLVLVPVGVLGLILGFQYLVEDFFLSTNRVRCPYCGPADDEFGKNYCAREKSCVDFFFPKKQYGDDVRDQCQQISETCGGGGNFDCFAPQWAKNRQLVWCPYNRGVTQPIFYYTTPPVYRSETPVMYTGKDQSAAEKIITKAHAKGSRLKQELRGASKYLAGVLFQILTAIPFLGCGDVASFESTIPDRKMEEGICRILRRSGESAPCCIDLTDALDFPRDQGLSPSRDSFVGNLTFGGNYWSPAPSMHNDDNYYQQLAACTGTKAACNKQIMDEWAAEGALFGSGTGKADIVQDVLTLADKIFPSADTGAISFSVLLQLLLPNTDGINYFRCVEPKFSEEVEKHFTESSGLRPQESCFQIQEGLAVLARYSELPDPLAIHPVPEPMRHIPECTLYGTCSTPDARWAQSCEPYSEAIESTLTDLQSALGGSLQELTGNLDINSLVTALNDSPCICRWLVLVKYIVSAVVMPISPWSLQTNKPASPSFNCSDSPGEECNVWSAMSPFSTPGFSLATSVFPEITFFREKAMEKADKVWGNYRFSDRAALETISDESMALNMSYYSINIETFAGDTSPDDPPDPCDGRGFECQEDIANGQQGNLTVVTEDCDALEEEMCWLRRMANLSGYDVGCLSAKSKFKAERRDILDQVYNGFWDRFSKEEGQTQEEFLSIYDFHDSGAKKLNVTVFFNNTTPFRFSPPDNFRVNSLIRAVVDGYINFRAADSDSSSNAYSAAMLGVKEMPKIGTFLSLDLGAELGSFFFTLAFHILFPTIVVSLVTEKEMKLRVMMQMMGLGSSAYWIINYVFWLIIYVLFSFVFLLVASFLSLPSGYKIGLVTSHSYAVHFVFLFLFVNQTIAFALVWATTLRSARVAQIASTLYVLSMCLIGWTAWDSGEVFNSEDISETAKSFITLFPIWSMYRAWVDYTEYAQQAAYFGKPGMQWNDVANDYRAGMDTVMVVMFVEWIFFVVLAVYLDQVLDSGFGVPLHPLFFLGKKNTTEGLRVDEESADHRPIPEDVQMEVDRVEKMLEKPEEDREAVVIKDLQKVYPAYGSVPAKMAVKSLTMAMNHGECFGMLGPNGAGKTTTINMLIGFTRPTSGNATIESFSVLSDMRRIYSILGVCPQHDILWDILTAREHMAFYGRLKNLSGPRLVQAIAEGLRRVNLSHVIDSPVGTFSGGMKRRLSVAISLIGDPLCCYLDEPSTGLDPASRRTLWKAVKEAKQASAIFLTTHSMEEAESLCDRLGVFVDGALRCIGNPKDLTARFGGSYVLTVTFNGDPGRMADLIKSICSEPKITYSLADTQKWELPTANTPLSKIFAVMCSNREELEIRDWGVANTTLEEAFIKISKEGTSAD